MFYKGPVIFNPASRSLLTPRDLPRFPDETLFCRIARAVCEAACLPRKELFESWEVARRVRRQFRGGTAFDLACGHGLIAHLMLILDDSSPRAVGIDARLPESAAKVSAALLAHWPRLAGRVELVQGPIASVQLERGDVVVSAHACGALTDEVLRLAAAAQARVAVLPCCHDGDASDDAGLTGWVDQALAIDAVRAMALRGRGYQVHTKTIPRSITPKNRLLLGQPLVELYEATRYEAHLPQGTVVLRHGEAAPSLDSILESEAPEWAFITAWNPGSRRLSRPENERRQAALLRGLSGRYRLFPGKGVGDDGTWPPELSVLVLGIPHREAIELGRAWGQNAVLLGARYAPARVVSLFASTDGRDCGILEGT
jgi:Protein of unknown function (DUF3293)/Methyltransferase domain